MDENDNKNGEKNIKKQMFVKGGAPGPGRGRKSTKPISDKDILAMLKDDIKSKDYKKSHQAIKLYMAWKKFSQENDTGIIIDPVVQRFFDEHSDELLDDPDIIEVDYEDTIAGGE